MLSKYVRSLVTTVVFATVALIPVVGAAAGWSPDTKITKLYPTNAGHIYVWFQDHINDGCMYGTSWKRIKSTNVMKDQIYSGLLAALTTGSTLRYYVGGCDGSYPELKHIQIFDY